MRVLTFLLAVTGAFALAACGQSSSPASGIAAAQADTPPQTTATARTVATAGSAPAAASSVPTGRLSRAVVPLAYTLDFTMDPDKQAYRAHETLSIQIAQPTDTIWLHGQGIKVSDATLKLADGKSLNINYKQADKTGVAKFTLPQKVQPQKATLAFDFTNPFSQGLLGAYKVKAGGDNYIFTQFEAIAARRAFVGFDQPEFKTPFTYSFTVPKGDKVVANTPVKSKTDASNGMVKWQFMTTKPLPTYLVAWAIGPLDIVKGPPIPPDSVRKQPIPLYGVTVKGKGDEIHYALQHAGKIIQTEEQYYGIAYPYRKLSLIAVPDFGAGAMENAGAITFRDILLLMDPKTATTGQKRAYWSVAAHEMGHMWTGDLVTLPWWTDTWLNESFATWMAQKVMDKLHPEWHPKLSAVQSRLGVMSADSLVSAKPVRQPVTDTAGIKNAFSGIAYQKGAAVISMFEHYIGPKAFRKGMHDYLKANAYGSGSVDSLMSALSKAAGKDIGPAFKSFLNQPGVPMVEVTLKKVDGKPTMHLVQSRYFPIGSSGSTSGTVWRIPVCVRYAAGGKTTEQCTLLTEPSADVALNTDTMPTWFMPNSHGYGYYQWSLGKPGYAKLDGSIDQLSPEGQLSFGSSVEAAFRAGKIDTGTAMKALKALADAKSHPVAEQPMGLISFARQHLTSGKAQDGVEAYARKLYGGHDIVGDFKPGGAPKEADQRQFEAAVAGFLAFVGRDPAVRKAANQAAKRVLGLGGNGKPDFDSVSREFLPIALRVAVRDQGKPAFEALEQAFKNASNPYIRRVTLGALTSATDPALAKRARAMVFEPGLLRKNEILSVIFAQIGQPQTREATWDWLKANYAKLVKALPEHFSGVVALPAVAAAFCSDAKAADVKAFFEPHLADYPGSKRRLTEAMESAHLCAALRKHQSASAKAFFGQF